MCTHWYIYGLLFLEKIYIPIKKINKYKINKLEYYRCVEEVIKELADKYCDIQIEDIFTSDYNLPFMKDLCFFVKGLLSSLSSWEIIWYVDSEVKDLVIQKLDNGNIDSITTGENIDYFKFLDEVNKSIEDLEFDKDMLYRHLNKGFSGGEKKKNEVLQIKMLKPKFIILDEIDSGLDVDSLRIVCENINKYREENKNTSILIITHYPRILEYIKPDYVHIMNNGKIVKTGNMDLAFDTEKHGYHERG